MKCADNTTLNTESLVVQLISSITKQTQISDNRQLILAVQRLVSLLGFGQLSSALLLILVLVLIKKCLGGQVVVDGITNSQKRQELVISKDMQRMPESMQPKIVEQTKRNTKSQTTNGKMHSDPWKQTEV